MAGIRQEGDFLCTIERQATWGTPISSAPIGLLTSDMEFTLEGDEHMLDVDRGIRFNHEDDRYIDTESTFPVCKFSGPLTSGMLKTVLPGLLQNATNWSPTTNVWDLFPQSPANLPTPRSITGTAAGYAYTIARRSPTASNGERMSDAICRRLKISLHPTNGKGVLWGEWEFIGTTFSDSVNLTPSASPVPTMDGFGATLRYPHGTLVSATYDGNSILTDFQSLELDMTFGAKFAGDIPIGEVLFPRFEATATLVCGQNQYTQLCKGYSRSQTISTGRPLVISWTTSTLDAAGEATITLFTKVAPDGFDDKSRADGETHTVKFMCEQGGTATEYPVRFQYYAA